jgi:hypothetical protein
MHNYSSVHTGETSLFRPSSLSLLLCHFGFSPLKLLAHSAESLARVKPLCLHSRYDSSTATSQPTCTTAPHSAARRTFSSTRSSPAGGGARSRPAGTATCAPPFPKGGAGQLTPTRKTPPKIWQALQKQIQQEVRPRGLQKGWKQMNTKPQRRV